MCCVLLATYKRTIEYYKSIYIFRFCITSHQQSAAPQMEVGIEIILELYHRFNSHLIWIFFVPEGSFTFCNITQFPLGA